MVYNKIVFIIILIMVCANIGVGIKLLSLGANNRNLIWTPVIIPLAFMFNIKYSYKSFKKDYKDKKNRNGAFKNLISRLFWGIKNISLLCGLVCVSIIEIQLKQKIKCTDKTKKVYTYVEKTLDKRYGEGLFAY
ncbi:hypothetical protein [Clostridium botulinum]|uniref:hypothetical protein n=1 Tax=Clostridium botulinum TaxID=1491 RepID=UPI0006A415B9|nr:hypothetical protein [Clostridium botulinum]KOC32560.1 hypothetical protein ADU81_11180 [Clostridium botulinum]